MDSPGTQEPHHHPRHPSIGPRKTRSAEKLVSTRTPLRPPTSWTNSPLDDEATFFPVSESAHNRRLSTRIKRHEAVPQTVEANRSRRYHRHGRPLPERCPMDWIPDFIAGKHGYKTVEYLHPKLEPNSARASQRRRLTRSKSCASRRISPDSLLKTDVRQSDGQKNCPIRAKT